jgi:urea carboxylase
MFKKVLIANRGAIACRIHRTLDRMGIATIAVYSEADANAPHVRQAAESWCIGPAPAAESYLCQERILEVAKSSGAQAIHPGYGFLSENAGFAQACEAAGIAFIGPTPDQMRAFGLKHTARALALENGLPLLPGSGLLASLDDAQAEAQQIGYPVMLKSTAGGGGIGMQQCNDAAELALAFASVKRLAANNFKDAGVFLEKYLPRARHIEVQIFGDGKGQVVAMGERDCSLQRRNQKVIEETPAPGLDAALRTRLHKAAVTLGKAVQYRSAGTVEFVHDADTGESYFLEVNTRLQVEHGVTEEVTGIDLVEWMVRTAAGEPPDLHAFRFQSKGHSIQARVYAEDAARGFRPCSGLLTEVNLPTGLRVDSWIESGTEVTAYYDPLLAKVIAHGDTRALAIEALTIALRKSSIHGIETNLPYLVSVLANPEFLAGRPTTRLLAAHRFSQPSIEVLSPGTLTTVQDWPGRLGFWDVGVPPSGPMDALAFRMANRMVGNEEGVAALEMTASGATLLFSAETVIALAGANMPGLLDAKPITLWQPIQVQAGQTLKLGAIPEFGQRTYLAIRGGLDLPHYMGSQSTFTLGRFGGHGGRALRTGDVLRLLPGNARVGKAIPEALRPTYERHWQIAVLRGPHAAPDFFTEEDIATFYATEWEVHYNSSRTGVRLLGPKPDWARSDGGEAGLHPSNIHDNAYAIGSIDYTGDMPVILGPDGPSLGGFVCPATIVAADLWKAGQLRPADRVQFHPVSLAESQALLHEQDAAIAGRADRRSHTTRRYATNSSPILYQADATATRPQVVIRQAGDENLLVEFGPLVLDLELRFHVQALLELLRTHRHPHLIDLTPGIRSLQIHFDARQIAQQTVLALLSGMIDALPDILDMELPSRIVHLPLSWNDPAVQLATRKYMQSVRADAPWCPDNIEFIRRINGLDTVEQVRDIVFSANYLVMGLGDVYLGAPVATPLDPRHRLVTTKYNPARTWTPENAVGIGGAYLCVYGMEGPGGYQFVGRTVQMWNRFRSSDDFRDGKQWLLRFFDQIRFYPVDADELLRLRAGFPYGQSALRIEGTRIKLRDYRQSLVQNADSIASFQGSQRAAFDAERERWRAAGLSEAPAVEAAAPVLRSEIPAGSVAVFAPVSGNVWQVRVSPGQRIAPGDELLVLEAMKMEISVRAELAGTVVAISCATGRPANAGDILLAIQPAGDAP